MVVGKKTNSLDKAREEVALAKKLIGVLADKNVSVFFQECSNPPWSSFEALDAWNLWISRTLTEADLEIYRRTDAYIDAGDINELRAAIFVESNRIPVNHNVDGY